MQVLSDFVAEMTFADEEVESDPIWILFVDGSSNLKGCGAGVILEGPQEVLIEQSLRFDFKSSNNQAEYEALIAGLVLAKDLSVTNLKIKTDSMLVASQIKGEYQVRDEQLAKYVAKVNQLWHHLKR